jgi:hypothetical protein
MRPITDDVVFSLMKGLEQREKRALAKVAAELAERRADNGGMTVRVLSFARDNVQRRVSQLHGGSEVIALAEARRSARVRRSVSGIFSYTART